MTGTSGAPRVLLLGTGGGEADPVGPDLLAGADHVFTVAAAESVVLFYAEAWRVERVDLVGAVRAITDLVALDSPATIVLTVDGDPAADPACRAVVDGLAVAGISAVTVPGVSVVPPRLSPLPW
ncbi:hypothetical protein GCM10009836_14430 [Pseudonocardia ailaonensis]|uniref:Tetrapyrrole methylase domain-containing protein n=1 Tax=Pseudonocardia ailaonensis TaxID=367279 RepID=A0ABN2MS86_9PSEU